LFDDARSKKVILVAHCILNQNAKLDRCAHYPGAIEEVSEILVASGVGLLQMPCPELLCMGLDRGVAAGTNPTIEAEDTRIAKRMGEADALSTLLGIIDNLVFQIQEYRSNGFEIVGVLGINGSPTCAVETTWYNDAERDGPGVFIKMLQKEIRSKGFAIDMRGIKAYEPAEAVTRLNELLGNKLT
jgi:predicted secreted protein